MIRIILLAVLAILLIRMLLFSRMEKKPAPWKWTPWQGKSAFSRKGVPKSLGEYIDFKEVKKKK